MTDPTTALNTVSDAGNTNELKMESLHDLREAFEALAVAMYANGLTPVEVAKVAYNAIHDHNAAEVADLPKSNG